MPIVGSLISTIVYWVAQYRIGMGLQHSGVFVLVAVIPQPVWFAILAFERSTWAPQHEPRIPATALA